jgi:16S rRNA (guanine966-N2)-methyltransferase
MKMQQAAAGDWTKEDLEMRIIAGQRRGHKFDGPRDQITRPTSDLVRESVFNILGEAVDGLLVIDLFAGTGALGLEALSRGAERAIFVERNRENAALIRRNIAILRYEDRAQVVLADAYRWVKSFVFVEDEPVVVFIDPPYADYEDHPERIARLLETLVGTLPDGSIISSESSRKLDSEILPDLESWDVRRYGGTQIAIRTIGSTETETETETDEQPEVTSQEGRNDVDE